jgi:hypothetical protein
LFFIDDRSNQHEKLDKKNFFQKSGWVLVDSPISKTVIGSSHIWFCEEFKALSFDEKTFLYHRNNRGEILKILRGQLFMAHPLCRENFLIPNFSLHAQMALSQQPLETS